MVNGGYYKGTGSGSMGRHTKHGGYIIEWAKVRNYMVPPNLAEFKVRIPRSHHACTRTTLRMLAPREPTLRCGINTTRRNREVKQRLTVSAWQLTPFVTKRMKPTRGRFEGDHKGALSPERFLARWKMENGDD